ncbi:MAG: substrate-binding domain-containing protein [Steroidobacteraceae bacterium]
MRNVSKIAMSVAAALVGSSAMALTPGTVHNVNLVVAGSSAFKSTFKSELSSICSDTLDQYTASVSSGTAPDMVAYSCTLASTSAVPAALQGKTALVYYRSEGGSVYGVGPLAKSTQILRLNADNTCTGSSPSYSCLVSGFSLAADTGSGHLAKDTVLLGISDEEPAMFTGENWPSSSSDSIFGAAPTTAQLNLITSKQSAVGQAFAVYVNSSVSASALSLSKQSLASIFSGLYTSWDQVPVYAGGSAVGTGDIVVCKRETGSGTQIAAAMYFNGANCSPAANSFVDSTVAANNSTSTELSCIAASGVKAIGYASIQSSVPSGTSIVNIDGVAPSRNAAALGNYGFAYEVSFNSGAALAATTLEKSLANTMISRLRAQATVPSSSASVFALPVGSNVASFANAADTSHPVSLGTRSGNSCSVPVGFN